MARLTGRHPELLRQWCAGRRLPCTRIGGAWALLEEHLALVDAMPARGRRRAVAPVGARRVVLAAVFTDAARGRLVHAELVRRFRLGESNCGVAQLSLDGIEMVLVAARVAPDQVDEAAALVEGLGGRIVADVAEAWALDALAGADAAGTQRRG